MCHSCVDRFAFIHCTQSRTFPNHASIFSASRAARLALFARISSFLCIRIPVCLSSTVCSQYPKLAPHPAKTGQAHRDPLLKNGRISSPSCQARVARPVAYCQLYSSDASYSPRCSSEYSGIHTEARPEHNSVHHFAAQLTTLTKEIRAEVCSA